MGELRPMRRVAVVGSPGAGKSTLSRELAGILGLKLFHLDVIYHQPGWAPLPEERFRAIQEELVRREGWIIDGNYGATLDIRLRAADTVVFLDPPRHVCLRGAFGRWVRFQAGTRRPDLAPGCPEKLDREALEFYRYIWRFNRGKRPKLLARLRALGGEKRIVHLTSRAAAAAFLRRLRANADAGSHAGGSTEAFDELGNGGDRHAEEG